MPPGNLGPMPLSVLALRGATTLDVDERDHLLERVQTLLEQMLSRNEVGHDDLISIIFTATPDVHSCFPALAARQMGLGDVPLLCAQELDIGGGMPLCVRVLMHLRSVRRRDDLHHVYLESAQSLRDDLPQ
jgi:chorismate mutase